MPMSRSLWESLTSSSKEKKAPAEKPKEKEKTESPMEKIQKALKVPGS